MQPTRYLDGAVVVLIPFQRSRVETVGLGDLRSGGGGWQHGIYWRMWWWHMRWCHARDALDEVGVLDGSKGCAGVAWSWLMLLAEGRQEGDIRGVGGADLPRRGSFAG